MWKICVWEKNARIAYVKYVCFSLHSFSSTNAFEPVHKGLLYFCDKCYKKYFVIGFTTIIKFQS